jgi:ABC-type sugar transport system ATPase subunit
MASVTLTGVTKVYAEGVSALAGLDLEIRDHEFLVLLGPSGCGKSTTLRLIAGLEEVTAGEIRIGDRVVNRVSPKDRDIAMVFQNYALYPHMTVYQNLAFGLRLRYGGSWVSRLWRRWWNPEQAVELGRRRREIPERVRQTAAGLGIESLLGRLPRQLSGGERQRVALGRAMVRQPAVFLFDEPLSNLDAKLRVETRRELKQLHGRLQATMIYVTHDQVEALTLGQRIAVLDRGTLQQVGSPLDVYDRPRNRFVASFIGSPPMNLVSGELRDEAGQGWFTAGGLRCRLLAWRSEMDEVESVQAERSGDVARGLASAACTWPAEVTSRRAVLGFRPEHVRLGVVGRGLVDRSFGERRNGSCTVPVDCGSAPGWLLMGQGQVRMSEALGDATYVHVELGGAGFAGGSGTVVVGKEPPRVSWQVGDTVEVCVAEGSCHLFADDGGQRLATVTMMASEDFV